MHPERLAAWLDSYRLGLRESLLVASEQGYRLVQAGTYRGELNPAELSASGRRHLRKVLRDLGLGLDALGLEHPGAGLCDPGRAEERVAQFRETLTLCKDLGVSRAAVRLSGFDDAGTHDLARELLAVTAELADRYGIQTTIHDPAAQPEQLFQRLREVGCPLLRVGLDTATLPDANELAAAAPLVGTIHLRDVRRAGGQTEEVPFGRGDVDFPALLSQLAAAEVDPSLALRHNGPGGVDALRQGREYIGSLLGRGGTLL